MIRSENGQRTAWVFVDLDTAPRSGRLDRRRQAGGRARSRAARRLHARVDRPLRGAREGQRAPAARDPDHARRSSSSCSTPRTELVPRRRLLLAVPFSLIGAVWFLWSSTTTCRSRSGSASSRSWASTPRPVSHAALPRPPTTQAEGRLRTRRISGGIIEGAVQRIRPKTMTVATDMIGLLPLLWATGTGADVTRRLVAPLIGGIARQLPDGAPRLPRRLRDLAVRVSTCDASAAVRPVRRCCRVGCRRSGPHRLPTQRTARRLPPTGLPRGFRNNQPNEKD